MASDADSSPIESRELPSRNSVPSTEPSLESSVKAEGSEEQVRKASKAEEIPVPLGIETEDVTKAVETVTVVEEGIQRLSVENSSESNRLANESKPRSEEGANGAVDLHPGAAFVVDAKSISSRGSASISMGSITQEELKEASFSRTTSRASDLTDGPSLKDFKFGEEIGEGAYGRVVKAVLSSTGVEYAVKIMDKKQIIREKKIKYVKMEKAILNMLKGHPFVVSLVCTFQDAHSLYLVLEYAAGGEIFTRLREVGSFDVDVARFYIAETICVLEYLREKSIVHRDLKPENMLLSGDGHLVLTDFGTSCHLEDTDAPDGGARKASFCGTAEYVSPEVLNDKPATYASDLWALGCLLFQMLTGRVPFKAESEYLIFQKILKREFFFPDYFPEHAKNLVNKLLALNPDDRLGAASLEELKQHPFFEGLTIDTDALRSTTAPALKPFPPAKSAQEEEERQSEEDRSRAASSVKDTEQTKAWREKWGSFLIPDETVVYTGLVRKRRGIFSRTRQLILTSLPRLIYVDPATMTQKGEIEWSEELIVQLRDDKRFLIRTPKRQYTIDVISGGNAKRWTIEIEKLQKSARAFL